MCPPSFFFFLLILLVGLLVSLGFFWWFFLFVLVLVLVLSFFFCCSFITLVFFFSSHFWSVSIQSVHPKNNKIHPKLLCWKDLGQIQLWVMALWRTEEGKDLDVLKVLGDKNSTSRIIYSGYWGSGNLYIQIELFRNKSETQLVIVKGK